MGRLKQSNIYKSWVLALLLLAGGHAYGQQRIYVSLQSGGDGSSWASTTSLADALDQAVAGDEIWVQGYEASTQRANHYVVPTDAKSTGFSLKSGVKLYGGFAGTETSIDERETLGKSYQFKYCSVLSGDIVGNDQVDNVNLIFPANTTRSDNAAHVLALDMEPTQESGNNNAYPTVVNGFTIAGGQNESGNGGAICVEGDNKDGGIYRIERCFLLNNYAQGGGAIYVSSVVKDVNNNTSLISQCAVYNNAAGERSAMRNAGGGIWIDGAGTVVNTAVFNNENGGIRLSSEAQVVNCTVARNTSGGIDAVSSAAIPKVYNTVIWGNTTLFAEYSPNFYNSAYHEATADDGNGNVYVSDKNRDAAEVPMFESPSSRTSFDRDFDWTRDAYPLWSWSLLEGSWLIDKGDDAAYAAEVYGNMDMAGMARVSGALDIGAYEFQQIPSSRIRYVKEGGTGDGSSWENASGDLQAMIDNLADNNPQNQPGEVWVAQGTYEPQRQIISGAAYSASFRMRDGISVYGGFKGEDGETKDGREKVDGGMPWQFVNETILSGAAYDETNLQWSNNRWNVTSDSRHVVWFAPMPDEDKKAFGNVTVLNGVTIQGGYAQGGLGMDNFKTDCGAGVYMGRNAYLTHCVVRANSATGNGGAVYLGGGRVLNSLMYDNNADGNGGGVYVDNGGIVLASMMTNNSADNGAGIYLAHTGNWNDGNLHPEYLILSTSIVSNNTARLNGAVYCDNGGVLLQNTIVNNNCPTATDNTSGNASQTGGLYIDSYALVVNSVLWKNTIQGRDVPMYARNPSVDKVRFMYTALSGMNNAVWNNTLQQEMIQLSDNNDSADESAGLTPDFEATDMPTLAGVDGSLTEVSYFWTPAASGSNLRARGMTLGTLPTEVLLAPELDIEGSLFAQKPAVGAYAVTQTTIQYEETTEALIVYVDAECTVASHNGSSWEQAYCSLNEAVAYLASLSSEQVNGKRLEVHVCEGDLWPRFAFTNLDPKTATVSIPATISGTTLYIYGGYSRSTYERNPLLYRSMINGNHEGKAMEDGLYHCITVADGANVVLDGFHVLNGYAAGEASVQYGAGMLVLGDATVTVQNSIFENNTALEGAAIDARDATLTLTNCVVNNNTNWTETASVINCQKLTLNHVTVVNNIGAAPSQMGSSSFSAGNTGGTDSYSMEMTSTNYANPTNDKGATLGFDTYFGGYSSFQPTNQNPVVNAGVTVAGIDQDIAMNPRGLGGASDLGAYEADLPADGKVIYVRLNSKGDGTSWSNALGSIGAALAKATTGQEIWVSAGTYVENVDMVEGVNVLGGFAATGSPSNKIDGTNRDISHKIDRFMTVIRGRDDLKFQARQANADELNVQNKRVLTQANDFTTSTMWEGFVITGGQTGLAEYGAGVKLMRNGHLKNCRVAGNKFYECGTVVYQERGWGWQTRRTLCSHNASNHTGGGGVYCAGGVIENCQIVENVLDGFAFDYSYDFSWGIDQKRFRTTDSSLYGKGAGISISSGNIINCVIAGNVAGYNAELNPNPTDDLTNILGAAVFVQSTSYFYSSTIVENTGGWSSRNRPIIPGVWDESLIDGVGSNFYNCIIAANYGYGSTKENFMQIGKGLSVVPRNLKYSYFTVVRYNNGEQSVASSATNDPTNKVAWLGDSYPTENFSDNDINRFVQAYEALGLLTDDYELNVVNGSHLCLNTGGEEYLDNDGQNIHITQDANGYDRIQDCALDIGAYESPNETNLAYETNGNRLIYYVTQNGAGLRSGASLDNAACAIKLQQILTDAGKKALAEPDKEIIVKLAGYESNSFTYHANTLSNPDDPQSYTYVIPYGVTVMGGYNEADADSWGNDTRNAAQFMTVLSAIYEPTSATAESVNGYHVVTFGEKPEGWTGADKRTILDGVYLEDGKATSMAGTGNPNTRGGGAIVPAWAHVRNCVVRNCEAIEGGGLYVMPGGIVSGCGVMLNTAETGAGIYANGEVVTASNRAHLVSSTVTDNIATSTGGGLYLEYGAMMVSNSVLWGNTAPSDKNVSGVLSQTFEDEVWEKVELGIAGGFYPVNHSFVETYEMPSNFENTAMESDESLYFANDFRILKAYSPLIKHGMDAEYQEAMQTQLDIATHDMQGIEREQEGANRVDAGAYAFDGGMIPTNVLITRIFVSQGANVQLPEKENMDDYIGRTFYTSLTWLDDALEYIRTVRSNSTAQTDTKFEILLAQGTYKPSYRRTDAATGAVSHRQNSYVIPQGVSIYGGFEGKEAISSSGITSVPGVDGVTFTADGDINDILDARKWSDFNQNGIAESWELTNQTILSGKVNTSENERNVYHVLYADADGNVNNSIVLDGLTVMEGETATELSADAANNEVGRGAGLYSNGVPVVVNRCRFIDNYAVRGGAIYVRNADLSVLGTIVAGNGTVEGYTEAEAAGGAVYLSGGEEACTLRAVNTLWVNNETAGRGGAIAVGQNGQPVSVSLMNNTFARNKAKEDAVASLGNNGMNTITNTAMWGNEGTGLVSGTVTVSHSAADAEDLPANADNIKLADDNMSVNGPRFAKPSDKAGVAGNAATNQWNPAAISVLTDGGDGEGIANPPTGAYEAWWGDNGLEAYKGQYMGEDTYARYAGPLDEDGAVTKKPIDIGVYEYQYKPAFAALDIVYVATQESGNGSGDSWANATSDLRGAIVAMANPDGGEKTDKEVRIRNGEYSMPRVSVGSAYSLVMSGENNQYSTSLTIRGSYNASGVQDYANPTVITTHEQSVNSTERLLNVQTSGKPVTMDGLSFINQCTGSGLGMEATVDAGGSLTLTHVAFRMNDDGALKLTGDGQTLIANALFADSQGTGLDVTSSTDNVTVVNATFANNGADMSDGLMKVYNTVSWKNGTQHLVSDNSNVAIASNTANDDMRAGPNFVNPDDDEVLSRDYHIYPSLTLLNKGSNEAYINNVLAEGQTLDNEKDLGGTARQVKIIDVGAYEYAAPLQPMVYVKDGVVGGNGSGDSWANAIDGRDLQGAVNLAGIYAQGQSEGTTTTGIVFVHRNVTLNTPLNVSLGNTKVYGGMNDETGADAVEILGKRQGLLTASARSILDAGLHMTAEGSVVDGFEVTGTATIENGMLSTSIVKSGATLNGGILYNTLLEGSVTGTGEVVNVTATGTLPSDAKNSRASVTGDNTYVTEGYWAYQLMETSTDIDKGNTQDITKYMTLAGHEKDISGTSRVRGKVDNGCFETWNITKTAEAPEVTADDRPTGKHVVYVRAGQELAIAAGVYPDRGTAFTPGFLLLEHQAGLRGNGNHIDLTNFAVERNVPASGSDLAYMPFVVTKTENAGNVTMQEYNSEARAAYDYKYDKNNGAWTKLTTYAGNAGVLLENAAGEDARMRFYGKSYTEDASEKSVKLTQYNFREPWSDNGSGDRFTHKENMGWNLFGSPYLCAMNYADMEYGRMIYGTTEYTPVDTEDAAEGHVPAGDAVFTQTATLKTEETFSVEHPAIASGAAYQTADGDLTLALSSDSGTDVLRLHAVDDADASVEFDMASDGVKWMNPDPSVPQIYAGRNGGRYSLLSAVGRENGAAIGIRTSQAGNYVISVPDTCDTSAYEAVMLTDTHTHAVTDLLESPYTFSRSAGGDVEGRFTVNFVRMDEERTDGIRVYSPAYGQIAVEGIASGYVLRLYDVTGRLVETRVATAERETFGALPRGIYLVQVLDADKKPQKTGKVSVL